MVQALKLLFHLNVLDSRLAAMLMVYYVEGDTELQEMIVNYLVKRGLEDPFGYYIKAMGDLSSLGQGQPSSSGGREFSTSLLQVCQEWLEEWAERFLLAKAPQLLKSSSPSKYAKIIMVLCSTGVT